MISDVLPIELRLLTLLCHLHPAACTPERLEHAMNLGYPHLQILAAGLLARRYLHATGGTWTPTSAGRLYVTHYLTTQRQERTRARHFYKSTWKVA